MNAGDTIQIRGVRGFGYHGVLPQERRDGQEFVVDICLTVDLAPAAASDDLMDTVDYASVATEIVTLIEGEPVNLIETLAERIAIAALAHSSVRDVVVTVHKPSAPVGVPFSDVSVRVVRQR